MSECYGLLMATIKLERHERVRLLPQGVVDHDLNQVRSIVGGP